MEERVLRLGRQSIYHRSFSYWNYFCCANFGVPFPYSTEHHSYKPVSGTVLQVDKKFMGDGGSTTESINLNINGVDYSVDDSRAATVRRGDSVNLKCVKDWNYGAEDGWNCKWNGVNK